MSSRTRAVVAAHILVVRSDEVLLLRRANTGYRDGWYSVPAGHVEDGEHPLATATRELAEEVGIAAKEADLRFAAVMHRLAEEPRIDYFFVLDQWDGELRNREPEKCDELRWTRFAELPWNVVPYVRAAIDAYREGRTSLEFDEID